MEQGINLLSWDTEFLGFGVGKLHLASDSLEELTNNIVSAREKGVRLLYWSINPEMSQLVANAQYIGAYLADKKVTYLMNVGQIGLEVPVGIEATHKLTSALRELTLQSGHHSRYLTDPAFSKDVYERLYSRWIENSITREIAREVLVYKNESTEVGLLTLGIKLQRVDIGLLAVDERVRGQSIGRKLIDAAKAYASEWGYSKLQVVTQQTNQGACRFYERCGFHTDTVEYLYHVWL